MRLHYFYAALIISRNNGMTVIKKNLQYFMILSIIAGLGNVYFIGGMTIGKIFLVFLSHCSLGIS